MRRNVGGADGTKTVCRPPICVCFMQLDTQRRLWRVELAVDCKLCTAAAAAAVHRISVATPVPLVATLLTRC